MKSVGLDVVFTGEERKKWADELLGETLRVGSAMKNRDYLFALVGGS